MNYLIVQLCNSSVSFCNYVSSEGHNLIPINKLESGLNWAIKNGLNIQILYPDYDLPDLYIELLNKFEHIDIKRLIPGNDSEIIVLKETESLNIIENIPTPTILQLSLSDFISNIKDIAEFLCKTPRLNICFTDIHYFKDEQEKEYENALKYLADKIETLLKTGQPVQCNILTDRIMLTEMNNCNAGVESITLAPDGCFYICPAFYLDKSKDCGNPDIGLKYANPHLYKIQYSPICRECDAFHCKRCIWLNQFLTNEVNTPGHQQCLMSHIERNMSRRLLHNIRKYGIYAPGIDIPQIDYKDPFDKIIKMK